MCTGRSPTNRSPGTPALSSSLDCIHRLQDGFQAEQAEAQTLSVRAKFEQAPLLAFDDFGKGHFTRLCHAGVFEPV
jgi:hypothetical protein